VTTIGICDPAEPRCDNCQRSAQAVVPVAVGEGVVVLLCQSCAAVWVRQAREAALARAAVR
jgi:hypothetical protein